MKSVLLTTLALATLALAACSDGGGEKQIVPPPGEVYPENNDSNLNGATARCVAKAMDIDDRRTSRGGEVFRGQRREGVRTINWEPRYEQTFDIFGMTDHSYGTARWTLFPASGRSGAEGKLVLSQRGSQFSVRSGLGGFVNLSVSNHYSNKEVELQCQSHSSFRRDRGYEGQVRCTVRGGENERRGRDEYLNWNGGQSQVRELWRNPRDGENVTVRLKSTSVVEIVASNLDSGKSVRAEGTVFGGLDFRYRGKFANSDVVVSCAPASK
ncbi:hypothetical protein [Bdellovibrio sp. HCB2-146]|uniref:hypothetical protein n=1 Tax=Bdellovibrio sp. HCB2-146 TaxID=3394362 RepID=UPI0039BD1EFC